MDSPKPPPLLQQAQNALKAVAKNTSSVLQGNALTVSREIYKRRIDACSLCAQYIADEHQCAMCGCYLSLKARLFAEDCPLGYWS